MLIRKLKYKNNLYKLGVYTYSNGRLHLALENKNESYDITIDIPDMSMYDGNVLLDPAIMESGILSVIKKARILNKVIGMFNYNYVDIPIAIVNMGQIRKYNCFGVTKHLDKVRKDVSFTE